MGVAVCLPLPTPDFQKQWDFALSNLSPDVLYVIGDSAKAPVSNAFSSLAAVYIPTAEDLPDQPLIALCPEKAWYVRGDTSLAGFDHPEEATYLFGPDHVPLSTDHLGSREPDHRVFIPTDEPHDMFAHVAYAVTMWDRRMKRG